MSYDVWIEGPAIIPGSDVSHNYTSNVSRLFYDHLPGGLPGLDGLTTEHALERLRAFWLRLNATHLELWKGGAFGEPKLETKYNSRNGWGSLVGAMIFLAKIQCDCERYPKHTVRVSA